MNRAAFCSARFHRWQRVLSVLLLIAMLLPLPRAMAADSGKLTARVVLRKAADTDSKALQTLPKGDEVDLLGVSGSWYRVRYGRFTGYVLKKYVKVVGSSVVANADKIAAIGDPPGAMRIGDKTDDVKKLQKALRILGYYKGSVDGSYGENTTKAVAAYQRASGLTSDGIAGKSTVQSIFGSCAKTSLSPSLNASAGTSKPAPSTSGKAAATVSNKNTVNSIEAIGSPPATSREGDIGTNVTKLQQALRLLGYYTGEIDGHFGASTLAAVKRFQKNRGLTQDGIAGAGTIRVLFNTGAPKTKASGGSSSGGSSSAAHKTEVLDWYDDNVSSVIPKNARFTVKDVRSGKTFQAVRWSGVNHLDAEPRTSEDTAALKSIYGGSWSWNRRAILILYNGHVYAASMNGMPHGTTTISNGFEGHFCIHFKNSKTHETDQVDSGHQAAVTAAGRATW